MAKRKSIVFPFFNDYHTSTAIIIYQTNVIKSLMRLPDEKKPHLCIWYNQRSPLHEIRNINYPYISFINIKSTPFRIKKLLSVITSKLGLASLIRFNTAYDIIYPSYEDSFLDGIKERIYWKADFQENYYPQYFTETEMNWVKRFFKQLQMEPNAKLVLSSNDAWNDLKKFYPEIKNPVMLYRFVSHIPHADMSTVPSVLQKFGISKPFYIVSNQFWPHKNHIAVIEALSLIKKEKGDIPFQVVFTGKTNSIRGNDYFLELQSRMKELNVEQDIVITGFMEREEQIILMRSSIAIVQPTLFEGWSTVIEDAKAMNQFVIASGLAVNREQISENVAFFEPHDHEELAKLLKQYAGNAPQIRPQDYNRNIEASVEDIRNIFGL